MVPRSENVLPALAFLTLCALGAMLYFFGGGREKALAWWTAQTPPSANNAAIVMRENDPEARRAVDRVTSHFPHGAKHNLADALNHVTTERLKSGATIAGRCWRVDKVKPKVYSVAYLIDFDDGARNAWIWQVESAGNVVKPVSRSAEELELMDLK